MIFFFSRSGNNFDIQGKKADKFGSVGPRATSELSRGHNNALVVGLWGSDERFFAVLSRAVVHIGADVSSGKRRRALQKSLWLSLGAILLAR